jgi:hypothetical protein
LKIHHDGKKVLQNFSMNEMRTGKKRKGNNKIKEYDLLCVSSELSLGWKTKLILAKKLQGK